MIHKCQKMEATQVPIHRRMDAQKMEYPYSLKQEGESDICYNVDYVMDVMISGFDQSEQIKVVMET